MFNFVRLISHNKFSPCRISSFAWLHKLLPISTAPWDKYLLKSWVYAVVLITCVLKFVRLVFWKVVSGIDYPVPCLLKDCSTCLLSLLSRTTVSWTCRRNAILKPIQFFTLFYRIWPWILAIVRRILPLQGRLRGLAINLDPVQIRKMLFYLIHIGKRVNGNFEEVGVSPSRVTYHGAPIAAFCTKATDVFSTGYL